MSHSILVAAMLAVTSTSAIAQTDRPNPLLSRQGWELGGQIANYHYEEPDLRTPSGDLIDVVLSGKRMGVVGAYTAIIGDHVGFIRMDGRISYGSLKYQGSGTKRNNEDLITEFRTVLGRNLRLSDHVSLSPYLGLGYRYLYNDLRGRTSTGAVGYRRYSEYFYAPVGMTLRFRAGGQWVIAPTIEYDIFLSGTQVSKLSDTQLGFSDASNTQDDGYGYRVYLMLENGNFSFGPWVHYWDIEDSDVVLIGGGFGAMEPANFTLEAGFELRYRF